jgi:predicted nuclease of predicted toxin-antitoxin system
MRLLADIHISPRTVRFLNGLAHDVVRVDSVLPVTASDEEIVAKAVEEGRAVLTQDLDFSDIVALSGKAAPSLVSLRLSDSRVENVNRILELALPTLEGGKAGFIASVEDSRVRTRPLPL